MEIAFGAKSEFPGMVETECENPPTSAESVV